MKNQIDYKVQYIENKLLEVTYIVYHLKYKHFSGDIYFKGLIKINGIYVYWYVEEADNFYIFETPYKEHEGIQTNYFIEKIINFFEITRDWWEEGNLSFDNLKEIKEKIFKEVLRMASFCLEKRSIEHERKKIINYFLYDEQYLVSRISINN